MANPDVEILAIRFSLCVVTERHILQQVSEHNGTTFNPLPTLSATICSITDRWTDRQMDRQQHDTNSRYYSVTVWTAIKWERKITQNLQEADVTAQKMHKLRRTELPIAFLLQSPDHCWRKFRDVNSAKMFGHLLCNSTIPCSCQ